MNVGEPPWNTDDYIRHCTLSFVRGDVPKFAQVSGEKLSGELEYIVPEENSRALKVGFKWKFENERWRKDA